MWKKAFLAALAVTATAAAAEARNLHGAGNTDSNVSIVYIQQDHNGRSANTRTPPEFTFSGSQAAQATQAELQSDPALASTLRREHVELGNVVGIKTDMLGGKTVYVR